MVQSRGRTRIVTLTTLVDLTLPVRTMQGLRFPSAQSLFVSPPGTQSDREVALSPVGL